ncbi:MAG: FKBP-type peptidyl-prolyl cis-trans isomerase [Paramuribaculum sp.]|nr:FKBP-type peptidyl-prolyl cis-trans isomerase [Paramuribaculum sp.]
MSRIAATIIALWVWALGVHAQIAPERMDSVNEAVASSLYPAIASQFSSIPADVAAKGFIAGATDSTAVAYAKAAIIGNSIMEWVAKEFGRTAISVSPERVIGILAGYIEGRTPAFTENEANKYISDKYVEALKSDVPDRADEAVEQEFLARAAKTKGAVVLDDSVVVIAGKAGRKPFPQSGSTVSVIYEASLSNGTVFDSTESKQIDLSFDSLAPGLRSGLATIGKGGSAEIYIPASAGYGSEGFPGVIPGGAALLYKITLVDVSTGE